MPDSASHDDAFLDGIAQVKRLAHARKYLEIKQLRQVCKLRILLP